MYSSNAGDKKKASRRAQAASSTKAAELLPSAATGSQTADIFAQFANVGSGLATGSHEGGVADVSGHASFASLPTALQSEGDAEIAMALKKLAKKDSVTKQKAIAELQQLVERKDQDALASSLSSFAVSYRRVALLDPDRRVREQMAMCLGRLAEKIGRRLSEQLKALAPFWLFSVHDSSREVAAAARSALDKTFPPAQKKKRVDLLRFCQKEFVGEMLKALGQTERGFEEEFGLSGEEQQEREERFDRVLSAVLSALAEALQLLALPSSFTQPAPASSAAKGTQKGKAAGGSEDVGVPPLRDWSASLAPLFGGRTAIWMFAANPYRPPVRLAALQALRAALEAFAAAECPLPLQQKEKEKHKKRETSEGDTDCQPSPAASTHSARPSVTSTAPPPALVSAVMSAMHDKEVVGKTGLPGLLVAFFRVFPPAEVFPDACGKGGPSGSSSSSKNFFQRLFGVLRNAGLSAFPSRDFFPHLPALLSSLPTEILTGTGGGGEGGGSGSPSEVSEEFVRSRCVSSPIFLFFVSLLEGLHPKGQPPLSPPDASELFQTHFQSLLFLFVRRLPLQPDGEAKEEQEGESAAEKTGREDIPKALASVLADQVLWFPVALFLSARTPVSSRMRDAASRGEGEARQYRRQGQADASSSSAAVVGSDSGRDNGRRASASREVSDATATPLPVPSSREVSAGDPEGSEVAGGASVRSGSAGGGAGPEKKAKSGGLQSGGSARLMALLEERGMFEQTAGMPAVVSGVTREMLRRELPSSAFMPLLVLFGAFFDSLCPRQPASSPVQKETETGPVDATQVLRALSLVEAVCEAAAAAAAVGSGAAPVTAPSSSSSTQEGGAEKKKQQAGSGGLWLLGALQRLLAEAWRRGLRALTGGLQGRVAAGLRKLGLGPSSVGECLDVPPVPVTQLWFTSALVQSAAGAEWAGRGGCARLAAVVQLSGCVAEWDGGMLELARQLGPLSAHCSQKEGVVGTSGGRSELSDFLCRHLIPSVAVLLDQLFPAVWQASLEKEGGDAPDVPIETLMEEVEEFLFGVIGPLLVLSVGERQAEEEDEDSWQGWETVLEGLFLPDRARPRCEGESGESMSAPSSEFMPPFSVWSTEPSMGPVDQRLGFCLSFLFRLQSRARAGGSFLLSLSHSHVGGGTVGSAGLAGKRAERRRDQLEKEGARGEKKKGSVLFSLPLRDPLLEAALVRCAQHFLLPFVLLHCGLLGLVLPDLDAPVAVPATATAGASESVGADGKREDDESLFLCAKLVRSRAFGYLAQAKLFQPVAQALASALKPSAASASLGTSSSSLRGGEGMGGLSGCSWDLDDDGSCWLQVAEAVQLSLLSAALASRTGKGPSNLKGPGSGSAETVSIAGALVDLLSQLAAVSAHLQQQEGETGARQSNGCTSRRGVVLQDLCSAALQLLLFWDHKAAASSSSSVLVSVSGGADGDGDELALREALVALIAATGAPTVRPVCRLIVVPSICAPTPPPPLLPPPPSAARSTGSLEAHKTGGLAMSPPALLPTGPGSQSSYERLANRILNFFDELEESLETGGMGAGAIAAAVPHVPLPWLNTEADEMSGVIAEGDGTTGVHPNGAAVTREPVTRQSTTDSESGQGGSCASAPVAASQLAKGLLDLSTGVGETGEPGHARARRSGIPDPFRALLLLEESAGGCAVSVPWTSREFRLRFVPSTSAAGGTSASLPNFLRLPGDVGDPSPSPGPSGPSSTETAERGGALPATSSAMTVTQGSSLKFIGSLGRRLAAGGRGWVRAEGEDESDDSDSDEEQESEVDEEKERESEEAITEIGPGTGTLTPERERGGGGAAGDGLQSSARFLSGLSLVRETEVLGRGRLLFVAERIAALFETHIMEEGADDFWDRMDEALVSSDGRRETALFSLHLLLVAAMASNSSANTASGGDLSDPLQGIGGVAVRRGRGDEITKSCGFSCSGTRWATSTCVFSAGARSLVFDVLLPGLVERWGERDFLDLCRIALVFALFESVDGSGSGGGRGRGGHSPPISPASVRVPPGTEMEAMSSSASAGAGPRDPPPASSSIRSLRQQFEQAHYFCLPFPREGATQGMRRTESLEGAPALRVLLRAALLSSEREIESSPRPSRASSRSRVSPLSLWEGLAAPLLEGVSAPASSSSSASAVVPLPSFALTLSSLLSETAAPAAEAAVAAEREGDAEAVSSVKTVKRLLLKGRDWAVSACQQAAAEVRKSSRRPADGSHGEGEVSLAKLSGSCRVASACVLALRRVKEVQSRNRGVDREESGMTGVKAQLSPLQGVVQAVNFEVSGETAVGGGDFLDAREEEEEKEEDEEEEEMTTEAVDLADDLLSLLDSTSTCLRIAAPPPLLSPDSSRPRSRRSPPGRAGRDPSQQPAGGQRGSSDGVARTAPSPSPPSQSPAALVPVSLSAIVDFSEAACTCLAYALLPTPGVFSSLARTAAGVSKLGRAAAQTTAVFLASMGCGPCWEALRSDEDTGAGQLQGGERKSGRETGESGVDSGSSSSGQQGMQGTVALHSSLRPDVSSLLAFVCELRGVWHRTVAFPFGGLPSFIRQLRGEGGKELKESPLMAELQESVVDLILGADLFLESSVFFSVQLTGVSGMGHGGEMTGGGWEGAGVRPSSALALCDLPVVSSRQRSFAVETVRLLSYVAACVDAAAERVRLGVLRTSACWDRVASCRRISAVVPAVAFLSAARLAVFPESVSSSETAGGDGEGDVERVEGRGKGDVLGALEVFAKSVDPYGDGAAAAETEKEGDGETEGSGGAKGEKKVDANFAVCCEGLAAVETAVAAVTGASVAARLVEAYPLASALYGAHEGEREKGKQPRRQQGQGQAGSDRRGAGGRRESSGGGPVYAGSRGLGALGLGDVAALSRCLSGWAAVLEGVVRLAASALSEKDEGAGDSAEQETGGATGGPSRASRLLKPLASALHAAPADAAIAQGTDVLRALTRTGAATSHIRASPGGGAAVSSKGSGKLHGGAPPRVPSFLESLCRIQGGGVDAEGKGQGKAVRQNAPVEGSRCQSAVESALPPGEAAALEHLLEKDMVRCALELCVLCIGAFAPTEGDGKAQGGVPSLCLRLASLGVDGGRRGDSETGVGRAVVPLGFRMLSELRDHPLTGGDGSPKAEESGPGKRVGASAGATSLRKVVAPGLLGPREVLPARPPPPLPKGRPGSLPPQQQSQQAVSASQPPLVPFQTLSRTADIAWFDWSAAASSAAAAEESERDRRGRGWRGEGGSTEGDGDLDGSLFDDGGVGRGVSSSSSASSSSSSSSSASGRFPPPLTDFDFPLGAELVEMARRDRQSPPHQASVADQSCVPVWQTAGVYFNEENPAFIWLLAARVYALLLRAFPAAVRTAWAHAGAGAARQGLERFTATSISPALIFSEARRAQEACRAAVLSGTEDALEDVTVRFNRRQRVLTARFEKSETRVEVQLQFPEAFPLRPVAIDTEKTGAEMVGVPRKRAAGWTVSIVKALQTNAVGAGGGGTVAGALRVWAGNLRAFFGGVDDCPICYSVVHPQHKSLPRQPCATCKYKFHSECIYRWFRTSHKTTCPLCQSPF
uniref:E3 ubiquitin-protein ligase listerin n=1 Tax=Chromera velia CCMP2878 TaxID=1169474 RepID=A0A0G4HPN5_9ALVE|eukprot:Cvel_7852.t1-p1 / transcript=Cvel_7852.t1 / gene=Cvel_7852 / organism=Chromera_velia_CCMP2878 / gene_product=E3 ubiquitin-protein ligase listerin, putative / transcript_product=E3 ubiquitin-protein ligase listerin, putative / location=Cvel_scaffold420:42677-60837(+) / protein_length=3558 / sequence_SO=supercontig / SO=protein_coding / is_pseudo=false